MVWWRLLLLLLTTSASPCLQHSRNHVWQLLLSSVVYLPDPRRSLESILRFSSQDKHHQICYFCTVTCYHHNMFFLQKKWRGRGEWRVNFVIAQAIIHSSCKEGVDDNVPGWDWVLACMRAKASQVRAELLLPKWCQRELLGRKYCIFRNLFLSLVNISFSPLKRWGELQKQFTTCEWWNFCTISPSLVFNECFQKRR